MESRRGDVEDNEGAVISVAEILSEIDDPDGLLEDGSFERICEEVLELVDQVRVAQGYVPYDSNRRIILVCEFFRVARCFVGKTRRSGEPVFDEHLMGSVKILLGMIGLNGVGSLVAQANHDTLEDCVDDDAIEKQVEGLLPSSIAKIEKRLRGKDGERRKMTEQEIGKTRERLKKRLVGASIEALKEKLIDPPMYQDRIEGFDPEVARQVSELVQLICDGVRKIKKATIVETQDATLQQLLEAVRVSVRAVFIKLADRVHNLMTLDGHLMGKDGKKLEGPELEEAIAKQRKIVDETKRVYLRLARDLGVRNVVNFFVDTCVNFDNAQLAADFARLSRERLAERLDPYKEGIYEVFASNDYVDSVDFVPRGLSHYTPRTPKDFSEAEIADLAIGSRDPMFEIVITTNTVTLSGVEIGRIAASVAELFKGADVAGEAIQESIREEVDKIVKLEERARAMTLARSHVASYFGGTGTRVDVRESERGSLDGVRIYVYSPKLGGHLTIRINNSAYERRLDRGVLANFEEDSSREFKNRIGPVLKQDQEIDMGVSVSDRSRKELLAPKIIVYDRDEIPSLIPRGATLLDFAYSIHEEVGLGTQWATEEELGDPQAPSKRVSVYDELRHGKCYGVYSCMAKGRRDRSMIRLHPVHVWMSQSQARGQMRRHLGDPYVSGMEGFTEEQFELITAINRKRKKPISTYIKDVKWLAKLVRSLNDEFPDLAEMDLRTIWRILKEQDDFIDTRGSEHIKDIAKLYGVSQYLLRQSLASDMDMGKPQRNKGGRIVRRDQIRRRRQINRAVGLAAGNANPLLVLANRFESVPEEGVLAVSGKNRVWKVRVVLPDEPGELNKLTEEFPQGGEINIDGSNTRKRPTKGTASVTMTFNLEQQGVSLYQFFLKVMKLKLKFGDVQITKNPYYRKRPQKGTWEVRYKRLQRALEAATARYEKHVRVTVDSVAARDRLATTIAERDPDLARKLGIEFPLTMETVGDELMRLRYASARGAVGDAEQRLGEMTDMILDQFPDLARELGLLDEEGDDEA